MNLKENLSPLKNDFIPRAFEVDISDKWSFSSLGNDAKFCVNLDEKSLILLTQKISLNIEALDPNQQNCFYLAIEYMKINDHHANQAAIKWLFNTNETISDIDIKCNIVNFLGYCETEYCQIETD